MEKADIFRGIRIMFITGYGLDAVKCDDGEYRQHYFVIKDDGTLIHYLRNSEDSVDDIIIKEVVRLKNGLEPPYAFSINDARGVGFASYTPQANVGASAALGAAFGGTAGALIGAAAASQANASASTYKIPITYNTGLSYLYFNEIRIESVVLFSCNSTDLVQWKDNVERVFSNKWIEKRFGRGRGFYDRYESNSYLRSDTYEKLAKHIEYYNKIVQYYCAHRSELSALSLLFSEGNAQLIGKKWESNHKISFSEIKLKELVKNVPTMEEELKKVIEYNIEQRCERIKWLTSQHEQCERDKKTEQETLASEHQKTIQALQNKNDSIIEGIRKSRKELSSLGVLKINKKKEVKREIESLYSQNAIVAEQIKEEDKEYSVQQSSIDAAYQEKRKSLPQKAISEYPYKPYGNDDAGVLNHLINSCPADLLKNGSARIYVLYCILRDNVVVSTGMILDALNAEYPWQEEKTDRMEKEALQQWLEEYGKLGHEIVRVDEQRYLEDDLWMLKSKGE